MQTKKRKNKVNRKIRILLALTITIMISGGLSFRVYKIIEAKRPVFSELDYFNSTFESTMLKDKNVLVVVPHEDDEINVAGSTIKYLTNMGSKVRVVFASKGDYTQSANTRYTEAVNSLGVLGVKEEDIIFLGYGDTWRGKYKHIYMAPKDEVVKSYSGATDTGSDSKYKDFRTKESGQPSQYTRNNNLNDLKDVILKYKPDTIFAVDFDYHPDHRATCMFFEEAMANILKNGDYNPRIFKGFAYSTSWMAPNDYSEINLPSTVMPDKKYLNNPNYDTDNPVYNWEDRVRFLVPQEILLTKLNENPIYKAYCEHKSQNATIKGVNKINSDEVFWERDTNSLIYNAKISASSGEVKYLNDFKLIDTSDIVTKKGVKFDKSTWTPKADDKEKRVEISLTNAETVNEIALYDNYSLTDNILSGEIKFSDGSIVPFGNLRKNGGKTLIDFEPKDNITSIEIKINTYEGKEPGLQEVEVYNKEKITKPKYIKLMTDDEQNNFIYRYVVKDEKQIALSVYEYPKVKGMSYKFLTNSKSKKFKLEDNKIIIKDGIEPGTYKVKVELEGNPEIYDEVEFLIEN